MATPYNDSASKSAQIETMFDRIAPRYDLLNRLLSMNISALWRNKLIRMVFRGATSVEYDILDVACGTGDLTFELLKRGKQSCITGLDLSREMLNIAERRITTTIKERITLVHASAESLPFSSDRFDVVTCAYGVRNFEHLSQGLEEMCRVTKTGGLIYILEFSSTRNIFFKIYFRHLLPLIGGWISGDRQAYQYLQKSVKEFPSGKNFLSLLRQAGFRETTQTRLSGGIATIYTAKK